MLYVKASCGVFICILTCIEGGLINGSMCSKWVVEIGLGKNELRDDTVPCLFISLTLSNFS